MTIRQHQYVQAALTPAEARALVTAMKHIVSNPEVLTIVFPGRVSQKVALGALRTLSNAASNPPKVRKELTTPYAAKLRHANAKAARARQA